MAFTSARILALGLLFTCGGGFSARVQAAPALHADFNADGILDTAVIQQTPTASHIEVRLSGWDHPFYLLAPVPLDTLHSADLTGDGRTDLVAHSSAGVLVWVNTGTQFLPAPVTDVLRRGLVPLAGSSPDEDAQPPTAAGDSDHAPLDFSPTTYLVPVSAASPSSRVLDRVIPRRPCTASVTRAPPFA